MSTPSEQYSTLEAVLPGALPYQNDRPFPSDPQKEVVVVSEKETGASNERIEVVKGPRVHVVVTDDDFAEAQQVSVPRSSQRKKILWAVAIFVIIIVVALIGVLLGARHSRSDPVGEATTNTTRPAPTAPIRGGLAAVSYTNSSLNETRVYYQDNSAQIMEAAGSAGNTSWNTQGLGFSARKNSAIAATVSTSNTSSLEITLVYMDHNFLLHDMIYNESASAWNEGTLADAQYHALPNSSIAAIYHQCGLCANTTLVAFQDANGAVQIANLTDAGWMSTEVVASAQLNTGLALHPFSRTGVEDQVDLYYQAATSNITLACWIPASLNIVNGVPAWLPVVQTLSSISSAAPIAAAASFSTIPTTGLITWIELLSPTETGLKVDTWSGNIDNWLQYDESPPAMSTLSNQRAFGPAAVTAFGTAFSIVGASGQKDTIGIWQVGDNMVDWSTAGNVDVGNAWD